MIAAHIHSPLWPGGPGARGPGVPEARTLATLSCAVTHGNGGIIIPIFGRKFVFTTPKQHFYDVAEENANKYTCMKRPLFSIWCRREKS